MNPSFTWFAIARVGLVQAAMGAIVVLCTSTLNRIMVVELHLPAVLPGILVALHYLIQISRPRLGHSSDRASRRTPYILAGMLLLCVSGVGAAAATVLIGTDRLLGLGLASIAFAGVGIGVSAAGTSLLILLAEQVAPARRAAAASIVWITMIMGFALTGGIAGHALQPYSPQRLITVVGVIALVAFCISGLALARLEQRVPLAAAALPPVAPRFRATLLAVMAEPETRRFMVFVFISMLAYSAQELVLEPYAGAVLHMPPGASTQLNGLQHAGVLAGMVAAALLGRRGVPLALLARTGCLASAVLLLALAAAPGRSHSAGLIVVGLGASSGAFSIAAIGQMMRLAGASGTGAAGVRMGLWGAAQAVAFACGGLLGSGSSDVARVLATTPAASYALVFLVEAILFALAAALTFGYESRRSAGTSRIQIGGTS